MVRRSADRSECKALPVRPADSMPSWFRRINPLFLLNFMDYEDIETPFEARFALILRRKSPFASRPGIAFMIDVGGAFDVERSPPRRSRSSISSGSRGGYPCRPFRLCPGRRGGADADQQGRKQPHDPSVGGRVSGCEARLCSAGQYQLHRCGRLAPGRRTRGEQGILVCRPSWRASGRIASGFCDRTIDSSTLRRISLVVASGLRPCVRPSAS